MTTSREIAAYGTLRVRHDDATRTVTTWDLEGYVTDTRPYTAEENAVADAVAASAEIDGRETALRDALTSGIAQAVTRRHAIDSGADALEAEVAALGSVSLAAVKALGGRVVTLARATADGQEDTIRLARLTVRALDSLDV